MQPTVAETKCNFVTPAALHQLPAAAANNASASGAGGGDYAGPASNDAVACPPLCDTGPLRQAVAIALVAAKRRRQEQLWALHGPGNAPRGGGGSGDSDGADGIDWRRRAEQIEVELTRMRSAAASLCAAVGLAVHGPTQPPPPAAPPPLAAGPVLQRSDSDSCAAYAAAVAGEGPDDRDSSAPAAAVGGGSSPSSSALHVLLQPLLLPQWREVPSGGAAPPVHEALAAGSAGSFGITAAGVVAMERERRALLQNFRRASSGAGIAAAAAGILEHPTAPDAVEAKAADLSRVLVAVQSLADLSASASATFFASAAATGPAALHAAALRHGGTPPYTAVLRFIEELLVGGGSGGGGGGGGTTAILAPDVRRAHLRQAVQLLAAVVHSLASAAAETAAAASAADAATAPVGAADTGTRKQASSTTRAGPAAATEDGRAAVGPNGASATAAAAAREQLLSVVMAVSSAVDRLLATACAGHDNIGITGGGAGGAAAAAAAAAVQTLGEMLAVPSLGQHVLVCAAEKVRDLGQTLAVAASSPPGAPPILIRQAAAAAAFNRSRALFEVLADCSGRLPGWCALVTEIPKPADVGPDYLASHVQALLAALALTSSLHQQPQDLQSPQQAVMPRSAFPIYGIAVRECLAGTAAALIAVASGGPEFAGCTLVPCCRSLCARIKQSALLPL